MKLRSLFVFIVFITLSALSFGQESIIDDIDNPMLEKYIGHALANYSLKKASDATVTKAKADVSIATMGLMDVFNAGYFYSPQRNQGLLYLPGGAAGTNNIVMRGFQFGVNLNLGNVLSKPATIRAAKADYAIAKAESEDKDKALINDVKGAYYDYLAARKQLELSTLAAKDLRGILTNAQTQFQNGTINIEDYTTAKNASIVADTELLTAEVTFLKSKNILENFVGEKLENVK